MLWLGFHSSTDCTGLETLSYEHQPGTDLAGLLLALIVATVEEGSAGHIGHSYDLVHLS